MESSSSSGITVSTTVCFKGLKYRGFDFTDDRTETLDGVRGCIAAAVECLTPSSSYTVEIKDDDEYVVLTTAYLQNKRPWAPCNSEQEPSTTAKKIKLRIELNIEQQPNVQLVLPPLVTSNNGHTEVLGTVEDQQQTTDGFEADVTDTDSEKTAVASTNANSILDLFSMDVSDAESLINYHFPLPIDKLHALAFLSTEPLIFVFGVRDWQRRQYPDELNLVMVQTNKGGKNKFISIPPVLQIPPAYVDFIRADGSVDLVSAVVVKVFNNDQSSCFCLAPHRGFWPTGKDNRPLPDTPFSNPFIRKITKEQLQVVQSAEGIQSCQLNVELCLMCQDGKLNDRTPQLVRFDETFLLSNVQLVPSHLNYNLKSAMTTTNVQQMNAEKEFYLVCGLRSGPVSGQLDWNSHCGSTKFTIGRSPTQNQQQ